MKYRAKITNIIPQIMNIKKYEYAYILHDATDNYIEVDTEEEAELIEDMNYTYRKAYLIYKELINITTK